MKPYYQDNFVTIYNGDCLELIDSQPLVDLVATDPPYGTNTQIWVNQISGKLTCHRAFCHTEIETEGGK